MRIGLGCVRLRIRVRFGMSITSAQSAIKFNVSLGLSSSSSSVFSSKISNLVLSSSPIASSCLPGKL